MEELFKQGAGYVALCVGAAAALLFAIGAVQALFHAARSLGSGDDTFEKREAFRRFGTWLVLALEFELAADVLRTAISPSWSDIGQLAAIAAIRTFLNFFLERDLEKAAERRKESASEAALQPDS